MFNGRNIQHSERDQHKSFHSPRRLISLMVLGPPHPWSALPAPKSNHRSWFPGRCPTLRMDPEPMWPLRETPAGWRVARRWLFSSEETGNSPQPVKTDNYFNRTKFKLPVQASALPSPLLGQGRTRARRERSTSIGVLCLRHQVYTTYCCAFCSNSS